MKIKYLSYIIIAALSLFIIPSTYAESPHVQVIDEGWRNHSGIVIESGKVIKVLTCAHMKQIHNSKQFNVKFFKDGRYISLPAELVKFRYDNDLMLLSIKNIANLRIKPVLVADKVTNPQCIINGYSFTTAKIVKVIYVPVISIVNGNKTTTTTTANGTQVSVFTGIGVSGMSGSGILSDGKIVSVQSSKGKYRISGADITEIRKFLKE